MNAFREQKRLARLDLHRELADTVLFLETRDAVPVRTTCRLHLKFAELGDMAGSRAGFADRQELTPSAIFLVDEVNPTEKGYIITRDMGAFKLDVDAAPDDITVKVGISPVLQGNAEKYGWNLAAPWCGFPAPEGE